MLGNNDRISDYDAVVLIVSDGTLHSETTVMRLKEALAMNLTVLPVVIGGNWWSNVWLRRKFKEYRFRSPYSFIAKESDKLGLYSQLIALSGAMIAGDPFGRIYSFLSDLDCQIIRDGEVIAEIKGGKPTDVSLYLGKHHLKIKCKEPDAVKELTISVDSIEVEEKTAISTRFMSIIRISSDINCSLYENNMLIKGIRANQDEIVYLPVGTHKLKFRHPVYSNLNRYVTVKLRPDENIRVVYTFPHTPKVSLLDLNN